MDKFVRVTFCLALIVFVWYVVADRVTPFTTNARVKAVVTPIVPQVSGMVTEVQAVNAKGVVAGAKLAQIDPRPYELILAKRKAQSAKRKAELEAATQEVGAGSSEVEQAQAELIRSQASLDNIKVQTARWLALEQKRLIPKAKADEARAALRDAQSGVEVAQAEFDSAKQRLGNEGQDNPKIKSALANLAEAELNLTFTQLLAPADGGVVNLLIAPGAQAQPGKTLMTFIDGRDIRVEAYMTENNLGRINVGDKVDLVLDTHPGRVFVGEVESVVSAAFHDSNGADGLPNPQPATTWLRDPQRFPVCIVLPDFRSADASDDVKLFVNGQADVIIYTGDSNVLNILGAAYIRALAYFSYLY
ncbi:HlyD family secretion protein [Motilimonas pumila]|uniref:HlyD family secretion protein n=1 Tax=Motilimonas pumila TaxID=2303987 RepID=A0A418YKI0_9GAMM|nr:HlyD family secretion protein [Motilimonas pumila]RJG51488.1 HlyD family secretion protein [Motilimonas pumila]